MRPVQQRGDVHRDLPDPPRAAPPPRRGLGPDRGPCTRARTRPPAAGPCPVARRDVPDTGDRGASSHRDRCGASARWRTRSGPLGPQGRVPGLAGAPQPVRERAHPGAARPGDRQGRRHRGCRPGTRAGSHDLRRTRGLNALHEMGDPVGVCRRAREALADGGRVMLVEPFAPDALDDNRASLRRSFLSGSTMVCLPSALSQGGDRHLGAQAPDVAFAEVARSAAGATSRLRTMAR